MATSAEAQAALNSFNQTRTTAQSAQAEAESKYGVSDLASRVSDLRALTKNLTSSVEGVDKSVTGRTSGTFTTEAQRAALVNKERQPILQQLNNESQNLNVAQGDLTNAQSLAGQMASAVISDQNTKYQSLMDQYNAAVQEEARKAEEDRWWKQFYEDQRKFDAQMAQLKAQYNAALSATSSYGGSSGSAGSASMSQRGDKGFNFTDASGKSISAATYSKLKGIPFRTLLSQMAAAGDYGAKVGLNLIGNDYGVDMGKLKNGFDAWYGNTPLMSYGSNGASKIVNSLLW